MLFDVKKPYCYYFAEMAKIPHGSKNEKAVSDWVVGFAKEHGLRFVQDEKWNVVVYKEGSAGYEKKPPVMLQAHLDMVCEKNADSNHDFEKDPIELIEEDGQLRANGTTLGGDDGKGVAYMMAILADPTLAHPPLECVFTSEEEIGLTGAMALKKEYFKAERLVNLDGGGEYNTTISTAGGLRAEVKRCFDLMDCTDPCYSLHIGGLDGGHSGGQIDKEKGNANKIAARILYAMLKKGLQVQLVSIEGGDKDNAIPRSSKVIFASNEEMEKLQAVCEALLKIEKVELEYSDPKITIELQKTETAKKVLSVKDSEEWIRFMYLMPHGMKAKSMKFTYLTMASMNFASMHTEDDAMTLVISIRSAIESWIDELASQVECLADLFKASVSFSDRYPGWNYEEHSPLRDIYAKVFEGIYHQPLELRAGHGGNECGIFKALIPSIDIITSGAIGANVHTPEETLDLASFDRCYILLTELLKAL